MLKLFTVLAVFLIVEFTLSPVSADDRLYGTWFEAESNQRIDILDGFEPGTGAVLILDPDGDVDLGEWKKGDPSIELTMGWSSNHIEFIDAKTFTWGDETYRKEASNSENVSTILLKDDPKTFVQKLTQFEWITSLSSRTAIFKVTFSEDSGVIEFAKGGQFDDLASWGISSGALKMAGNIIVEARVSDKYFIGLDGYDDFVVFRSLKAAEPMVAIDVKEEREKFFDEFLTDEWFDVSYGTVTTNRFRPIYGELKGVNLWIRDGRHVGDEVWEYSPSTGAIQVGYTEFIGAVVVNNTLAFLKEDGGQVFYNRAPGGAGKRFATADVTKIPLNENSLDKISNALLGQFQNGDYLYHFEFNQDRRTGFLHRWRSEPFNITGETFSTPLYSDAEALYAVEDFVILDESVVFKRDVSESRLRPKTEEEVFHDISKQQDVLDSALNKAVLVRLIKTDGTTVDVKLPVADFGEISSLLLLRE